MTDEQLMKGAAAALHADGFTHVWLNEPGPRYVTATKGRWMWVVSCATDWREAMRRGRRALDYANFVAIAVPMVTADNRFAAHRMGYGLIHAGNGTISLRPRMKDAMPSLQSEFRTALKSEPTAAIVHSEEA